MAASSSSSTGRRPPTGHSAGVAKSAATGLPVPIVSASETAWEWARGLALAVYWLHAQPVFVVVGEAARWCGVADDGCVGRRP